MVQGNDEGGAFTFDDDEDMDFLMEQAANAGSAAVDEQHEGGVDTPESLFGGEVLTAPVVDVAPEPPQPVYEPEPQIENEYSYEAEPETEPAFDSVDDEYNYSYEETAPEPAVVTPESTESEFNFEEEFSSVMDASEPANSVADVERELAALQAETEAVLNEPVTAPVKTVPSIRDYETRQPTPEVAPVQERVVETPTPVVAHPQNRIIRQTEQEQVAHAKAVVAAVDEYRKLNARAKSIVAQLISQDAEFSDDESTIAVRAINTDELTFSTIEALKTAKNHEPVDRAFYILGLAEDVRASLGQLCTAFSGNEITNGNSLAFSRELVREIDNLDAEAISFISSTEAVLRAAKQR